MPVAESITNFGALLKYLRRSARLTQRDLGQATGYTEAHICRLEKNMRPPDMATLAALFVPALELENRPDLTRRLLQLASDARWTAGPATPAPTPSSSHSSQPVVPAAPPCNVMRSGLLSRVRLLLSTHKGVAVVGLAGMGKTTLAAAVARECSAHSPVFWLSFLPGVTTSADAVLRQLARFLLGQGCLQVRALAERPPDAAALPLDQSLGLLGAALNQQPALLCFDDVHLAFDDAAIMSVLHFLSASTPATLLLTGREDIILPALVQVNLTGLEPTEAQELISRLGLHAPPALRERLLSKTGRSPMLLRLAAGQLLGQETDSADYADFIEHLQTQPQVSAYILDTMLRDLSPAAAWLAGLIAVFRQPVDLFDETLGDLLRQHNGPTDLRPALAELQRRHLVDHPRAAALHPLVADHLLATLAADAPFKRRLHRIAAEWSERATDDVIEAAHHYACAGDPAQATEVIAEQTEALLNQGQAERAAAVVDETLLQLRRKRGDTTTLRRRLLCARGDLLRLTLRIGEAESSYREALTLAGRRASVRADIAARLAQSLLLRGQAEEALLCCQTAAADLPPADVVLLARLAAVECRALRLLSRFDDAVAAAQRALALAERFAAYLPQMADDIRARSERVLGFIAYTRAPAGQQSLVHYRRALAAARRGGLRVSENAVLGNIAVVLAEQGDLEGALKAYQEAQQGGEAIGDMQVLAAMAHNMAGVHFVRHDLDAALAGFARACDISRRSGDSNGLVLSLDARAAVLIALGRLDEARTWLEEALVLANDSADTWSLGSVLCTLSEVLSMQGDARAAAAAAQRALTLPGVADNARIRTQALSMMTLAHVASGDIATAQATLTALTPDAVGLEVGLWRQIVESAVALAAGEHAHAARLLQAISEQAEATGYQLYVVMAARLRPGLANRLAPAALVRCLAG